jgi:hypothetical protein
MTEQRERAENKRQDLMERRGHHALSPAAPHGVSAMGGLQ